MQDVEAAINLQFASQLSFIHVIIAVYLYGEAATEEHRKTVPQIRAGEYEGLMEKVFCFVLTIHRKLKYLVLVLRGHCRTRNVLKNNIIWYHCLQLSQEEWKPDFGLPEFVPAWGATLVGARKFLIAYNVNLLSTKEQAHRIALNIREQGRSKEEVLQPHQLSFTGVQFILVSAFQILA